jgi:hypothetical protein
LLDFHNGLLVFNCVSSFRYCAKQIQMRVNAKLKGKLNVFDGEEAMPRGPVTMQSQINAPRAPMPAPAQPGGMRPPMHAPGGRLQTLGSFDGDDASVPLGGGRGPPPMGTQRLMQQQHQPAFPSTMFPQQRGPPPMQMQQQQQQGYNAGVKKE